ncbi:MAG: pitrilysin family protein [Gemmatimonadota bacterium]
MIVVENHAVPLATAHVVFRGGAMTQTVETAGVPHLFEHMLFKAFGADGAGSFGSAAAEQKAAYNGATSDEEVSYTLWFPSGELGGAIGLMADLVRDPFFTDANLQVERFVVRNEMQRAQSQPSYLLDATMRLALWGSWFPRKNTIGTDMALFAVNAARLKVIYDTWYVPNNAALVVTGDVNADKVFGEARKAFGRWRRREDPTAANPVPAPPPLDSTIAFVYTHEVQTVTVQVSWRGPSLAREAADVRDAATLADLLNADDSPFQRMLVDGGYFQSATMSADINQHGSEIRFSGTTTLARLTDALGVFGTAVGLMGTEGYFDEASLAADARRDRTGLAIAFEETQSLAQSVGSAWAVRRLDNFFGANEDARARAVTPATLLAFAQRWLSADKPYVIGVLTPVDSQQAVTRTVSQYVAFMKP